MSKFPLKLASFIGGLMLSLGSLHAAGGAARAPAQREAADRNASERTLAGHRPWVWEVDGAHARIWIVGCLHLGGPRDTAVFPSYLPYYRDSAAVYFETAPGAWNSDETKQFLKRIGFLPDQQQLSSKISRSTWQVMEEALASDPRTLAKVNTMEPWMAALDLTQTAYSKAGLRSENSLQGFFEHRASVDRKPVGGLETPKDQIRAMADTSPADQEEYLLSTVRGLSKMGSETTELRNAWLGGNEANLQSILGLSDTPLRSGMHRNLIGLRNRRWIRKIRDIEADGKNAMIVVGAEHLVSTPYALPDLLTQAGFQIHRISLQGQGSGPVQFTREKP